MKEFIGIAQCRYQFAASCMASVGSRAIAGHFGAEHRSRLYEGSSTARPGFGAGRLQTAAGCHPGCCSSAFALIPDKQSAGRADGRESIRPAGTDKPQGKCRPCFPGLKPAHRHITKVSCSSGICWVHLGDIRRALSDPALFERHTSPVSRRTTHWPRAPGTQSPAASARTALAKRGLFRAGCRRLLFSRCLAIYAAGWFHGLYIPARPSTKSRRRAPTGQCHHQFLPSRGHRADRAKPGPRRACALNRAKAPKMRGAGREGSGRPSPINSPRIWVFN